MVSSAGTTSSPQIEDQPKLNWTITREFWFLLAWSFSSRESLKTMFGYTPEMPFSRARKSSQICWVDRQQGLACAQDVPKVLGPAKVDFSLQSNNCIVWHRKEGAFQPKVMDRIGLIFICAAETWRSKLPAPENLHPVQVAEFPHYSSDVESKP